MVLRNSEYAVLEFVLPPSLAVSPVVHASGVRSGRSCHTQPTRPGSLPHGQLSAPGGLRIRAYSSPLCGLLPAACSAHSTPPSGLLQCYRGARGQRASRPASCARPTHGRPVCCCHALVRARPVYRPARAAKASLQWPLPWELEPYSYLLEPGGTSSALTRTCRNPWRAPCYLNLLGPARTCLAPLGPP